ncbi:MAG TPA: Nre family DNA repair protein [Methanoregulaceae archaeon]|nr:Nre family DNA repair protein [Methanoregulaceae archaeon]
MSVGKGAYLRQITSSLSVHAKSMNMGRELDGSSPPSVFIGSYDYPHVFAGPMIAPVHGDTRIMDTPESWIPASMTQEEIIDFRLSLVRGKHRVHAGDLDNRFVGKLQDIALSSGSIESEATFLDVPSGLMFSDESAPHGPSARIENLDIVGAGWDRDLEKVYHDTDLPAAEGVVALHAKGIPFSQIQKAFSVGAMGTGRNRKLVPTRWSITACDTMIGNDLLRDVRKSSVIDSYRVHQFDSLNNHYAVILTPTPWQYEWIEAFLHVLGRDEMVFADHEGNRGKKGYSTVGGCYYSCKMAVLDALASERVQAGAIILREARKGYIPLGVFNVRENVRHAMASPFMEFESLNDALVHVSGRFSLPVSRFCEESTLLKNMKKERQMVLSSF